MSAIFESIQVSDDVKRYVDHSFDIVNRIYDLLEKQGKTQRDLANLMGKKESEISKWMQGSHNFTLKSIAKIESVLGEKLIVSPKSDEVLVKTDVLAFYHQNFEIKATPIQQIKSAQEVKKVLNPISFQISGETVARNNASTVEVAYAVQEKYPYLKVA
ncbi:helix-turn-helix transcriptional regulator [Algoriphagus sp. H41]|uniref:Helix-turn-helix transcriptional regulator n=1 Tax=Algoriphagus oliviformis TaxID=2811231 RepID=A0ABS3C3R6_9BACT|nr:helix-turn-helix transcriptional regulator [Algoriphagus oliviformis]MBN7810805.1 helix-turn-helix transcriptional regulator [Algoriphagus oliviformis]